MTMKKYRVKSNKRKQIKTIMELKIHELRKILEKVLSAKCRRKKENRIRKNQKINVRHPTF